MNHHLASLREMRAAMRSVGFPTPALDEEIALLTAVDDPFLSPAEVAEVRALLAKGYAHPMVSMGIAEVPEAAALLAIDLASGACTRVMDVGFDGDCGDDTPQAYAQGLNDARQNDADALDLEERTRR